jgi:CRP-like cAMP-binding protein
VSADIRDKNAVHPGIADLGPNDIFGEFGLYDEEPANADVIAVTASELVQIDITTFRTFLKVNPQIGNTILEAMFKTLIKRLRHADETIIKLYIWGMKAHKIDQDLDEGTNEKKC